MLYVNYLKYSISIFMVIFGLLSNAASAKECADDAFITTEIKTKMAKDPLLSDTKLQVETNQGMVFLKGKVNSSAEAHAAIELAAGTKGVMDVDASRCIIEGGGHPIRDTVITAKIKGVFAREKVFGKKPITVSTVHVETTDGIVYLTGKVKTKAQKKTVEKLANSIKGVRLVKSNINTEEKENKTFCQKI